jgi:hypothetical protein
MLHSKAIHIYLRGELNKIREDVKSAVYNICAIIVVVIITSFFFFELLCALPLFIMHEVLNFPLPMTEQNNDICTYMAIYNLNTKFYTIIYLCIMNTALNTKK